MEGGGGREETNISKNNTSFLVDLRLVIVIDLEPFPQNLIFIRCERALLKSVTIPSHFILFKSTYSQFLLRILSIHPTLLDQRPKSRVVEIVYVTLLTLAIYFIKLKQKFSIFMNRNEGTYNQPVSNSYNPSNSPHSDTPPPAHQNRVTAPSRLDPGRRWPIGGCSVL